jgi:hypothetical protein
MFFIIQDNYQFTITSEILCVLCGTQCALCSIFWSTKITESNTKATKILKNTWMKHVNSHLFRTGC